LAKEEAVDVVDRQDRVVGTSTVSECLRRGLLHRAVAVVVSRSDRRIVLQQRSRRDAWRPGMWTLSSTGHVKSGEAYADAAARELKEELGIEAPLSFLCKRRLPAMREGGLTECEWVALYSATSDAEARVDPGELEGARAFSRGEVTSLIERGDLTPDAAILLKYYFRRLPGGPSL
jgi:isopentenyl-diphosphate delta-isomerase